MKNKWVKIIGFVATAIGLGASLVSEWANDKKINVEIDKKVKEAITKKEKES